MTFEVLDPTYEGSATGFQLSARVPSLVGKRVGLISNGKRGTRPFFTALERHLLDDVGVVAVEWKTKSNYSAPAEAPIMAAAANWNAAFVGIGD